MKRKVKEEPCGILVPVQAVLIRTKREQKDDDNNFSDGTEVHYFGSCWDRFMEKCFILGCLEPVYFNPMEIDWEQKRRMICVNKFSFYLEGLLIV